MLPKLRLPLRGRRDIVCQQAVELVTDYLEGALSPVLQARGLDLVDVEGLSSEEVCGVREISEGKDEFVTLYRQWRGAGEDGT